jgi:hypothetical protein
VASSIGALALGLELAVGLGLAGAPGLELAAEALEVVEPPGIGDDPAIADGPGDQQAAESRPAIPIATRSRRELLVRPASVRRGMAGLSHGPQR